LTYKRENVGKHLLKITVKLLVNAPFYGHYTDKYVLAGGTPVKNCGVLLQQSFTICVSLLVAACDLD